MRTAVGKKGRKRGLGLGEGSELGSMLCAEQHGANGGMRELVLSDEI